MSFTCPNAPTLSVSFHQLQSGTHEASWVLQRISSCMPRLRTPPDLHILTTLTDASVLLSVRAKTLSVWIEPFEARYILTTRDGPYGQYMILCVRLPHTIVRRLPDSLNEINTRYGWLVRPYPTRTFTLQDTLSFAQRDNAPFSRNLCGGACVLQMGAQRACTQATPRKLSDCSDLLADTDVI